MLFSELGHPSDLIEFQSRSGPLRVARKGDRLTLDFPTQPPRPVEAPAALRAGLGAEPAHCLAAGDYLAVYESEEALAGLDPDFSTLAGLDRRGIIATAPADRFDFVVRFFAPALGIPEDPVTGSAYTQLAPYWAQRLGRDRLRARQISRRGGNVECELAGERVLIGGRAVKYLQGQIELEGSDALPS